MTVLDRARQIVRDGYPIGPRLYPCACGQPRHTHSGAKLTGGNTTTGCRRYRRDTADALAEKAMTADRTTVLDDIVAWHTTVYPRPKPTPDGLGIGPSDISTCRKRIQLRERPPADIVYNDVDESAATLGSIFHDVTRRARQHLYPWRRYEFEVPIPSLDRPGRMDEYDPITAVGTDYKSSGEYSWEILGAYGPREDHFKQLAIYCYALTCLGYEVHVMRLIYIRRATGESEIFDRPYSEEYAKSALGELTATALALDLGEDLPRDGRGPTSDAICARHCPMRDYCWNVEAAAAAGRTPESYTILGPHPQLAEIEWAAAQARDWKDNENEAAREYKAAIPLLGGLPDGTYGDFIITEKTRLMPDYKTYYQNVSRTYSDYLLTPEHTRGDFTDWLARVPLPRRRDTWTEVRRVRAANRKSATDTANQEVTTS